MLQTAWLKVVSGPQRGRRVPIDKAPLRIGKAEGCVVRLPDDPLLGIHHAEILRQSDGSIVLVDNGAAMGTRLNGNSLRPQESVHLRNGDRIAAGSIECVFVDQRVKQSEVATTITGRSAKNR